MKKKEADREKVKITFSGRMIIALTRLAIKIGFIRKNKKFQSKSLEACKWSDSTCAQCNRICPKQFLYMPSDFFDQTGQSMEGKNAVFFTISKDQHTQYVEAFSKYREEEKVYKDSLKKITGLMGLAKSQSGELSSPSTSLDLKLETVDNLTSIFKKIEELKQKRPSPPEINLLGKN
jgi:hypothetical protein